MKRHNRDNRITLVGIKLYPRIGITPEERSSPQVCEADLSIWYDFEGAASQDSIETSIDYTRLLAAIQDTARKKEYSLVETLAYTIVRKVLQDFPVERVHVKVRKKPASLQNQIDYVEVEVEES